MEVIHEHVKGSVAVRFPIGNSIIFTTKVGLFGVSILLAQYEMP